MGFAYLYLRFGLVGRSNCANSITTIGQALYFSVVTITTLGYGDIRPITWQGRALTSIEPIMGIVLLIVIAGLFFVEMGRRKDEQKQISK
jgi:voltage-gated potassium channel